MKVTEGAEFETQYDVWCLIAIMLDVFSFPGVMLFSSDWQPVWVLPPPLSDEWSVINGS